jgi:hypothetical protein
VPGGCGGTELTEADRAEAREITEMTASYECPTLEDFWRCCDRDRGWTLPVVYLRYLIIKHTKNLAYEARIARVYRAVRNGTMEHKAIQRIHSVQSTKVALRNLCKYKTKIPQGNPPKVQKKRKISTRVQRRASGPVPGPETTNKDPFGSWEQIFLCQSLVSLAAFQLIS